MFSSFKIKIYDYCFKNLLCSKTGDSTKIQNGLLSQKLDNIIRNISRLEAILHRQAILPQDKCCLQDSPSRTTILYVRFYVPINVTIINFYNIFFMTRDVTYRMYMLWNTVYPGYAISNTSCIFYIPHESTNFVEQVSANQRQLKIK